MNCWDCAAVGVARAAAAVCVDCGAAMCAEHGVCQVRQLYRAAPINRQIPVDLPARVLRCRVCDAARAAVGSGLD
jgi:hypothetical protein